MAKYKKRKDGRYLVQVQIGVKEDGKPKFKNIYGRTIPELEKKSVILSKNWKKELLLMTKG